MLKRNFLLRWFKRATIASALVVGYCCVTSPVWAQLPVEHAPITKYVSSETSILGWIDVADFNLDEFKATLLLPPTPGPADEMLQAVRSQGAKRVYVVGSLSSIIGDPTSVGVVIPTTSGTKLVDALGKVTGLERISMQVEPDAVVIGVSTAAIEKLVKSSGPISDHLKQAVESCNGAHGLAVGVPPGIVSTLIALVPNEFKQGPTGDPLEALSDVQWLSASGSRATGVGTVQAKFATSNGATREVKALERLVQNQFGESLGAKTSENKLSVELSLKTPFVEKWFATMGSRSARYAISTNNMKQLALAMHNYASIYNRLPPQALADKQGKPLLSWRVLMLPFISEEALYKEFHLDEPWDSPHNLTLVKKMPRLFDSQDGANIEEGQTRYVAPLTKNSMMGITGKPPNFPAITDGTSMTVWLVETTSEHAVTWTKPEDLVVQADKPLEGIAQPGEKGFIASFIDGSVRRISSKIDPKMFLALVSINGGEVIDNEKLNQE